MKSSLECLTARCLLVTCWCMGLLPLPLSSQLLWLLLALLVRGLWLVYYLTMLWKGLAYLLKDEGLSISYVSGTALYLGYSLLGLLLQAESIFKQRTLVRLEDLRFQLQLQMQRLGMSRGCRRAVRLLLLLGTQLASDLVKTWANAHYSISPVHISSMPQKWLLRFRYVQLLWLVTELNQRTLQLRHSLLSLAAGNDIFPPIFGPHDWQQLQSLRLSYDRIYECYEAFSDCYGWGMLGLQMMCGLEFVSNAYWIITEAYISQRLYMVVFNANTCFAMGTLIVALFWYGDASTRNLFRGSVLARELFHLALCLFGIRWNVRLHRLQFVPFFLWFCWFPLIWTGAVKYMSRFPHCQLDCLITLAMFVTLTLAHFIILLDTFVQRRTHRQLELSLDMDTLARRCQRNVAVNVCGVFVPFLVVQSLIAWSRLDLVIEWYTPFFWLSTPSACGVQLKLIAFLSEVLVANERVSCMQHSLKLLATPNVGQVVQFKLRYRQLHQLFAQLNLVYGVSLLIIFIVLFFDFLFNSYWLARHMLTRFQSTVYIFHYLGFLLNLGLLLSVTCWHCQQSFNHSRQIGCLIPKLVRPTASKRYNDLVSEFLLQTLHQRFVVTAKDFFSLNLHLLSSMFAAVVTYLVILIQFMFAEKSSQAKPEKPFTAE